MKIPQPLKAPDLTDLRQMVAEYIESLAAGGYLKDEDEAEHIFEAAVEALYGKDIWGWINGKLDECDDEPCRRI